MVGLRDEKVQKLRAFVEWVGQHITGDEKGQAQIFLDRLFQACGQPGCLDVGGAAEFRIRKASEDGGGTAFADYVWKPVVLIEMKKRGTDLNRHFRQAFDYWTRLVPGRPRYVILCNFDEFWVYDFESQMDSPVDKLALADLPERFGPLGFLFRNPERPVFGNDHVAVTREAADLLAACFQKLIRRPAVERETARQFILQMLVALFAEDIGLLDEYTVVRLLEDCHSPQDSYDLLGGLFVEMNTPGVTKGGRYKGVDYFNGGLFREPARLELHADELNQLKAAAKKDWSQVQPEIFGTIFEHSMEATERHAFGAHFTSPVDIMKIVGPTIVEPWRQLIDEAKTIKRLGELRLRLQNFRVLDPACGSGNFLYIAYREMKRLEARIFERMREVSGRHDPQKVISFVTAGQFFGIDINPFAVELAKVTMMIARKLAIDELHVTENALPLDNLDANFLTADALIDAAGNQTIWPPADVIIGNPPFLGAKRLKPERGPDYVNAVRELYPDVPGMADYCVYWIRKAHDHLPICTPDDPVAGRAGLVGTQNIRNNKSRVGGLDHVVQSGTIVEAVDNQPWSGEANVHVSIANWVKHEPPQDKFTKREQEALRVQLLIPRSKKLWFKVETGVGRTKVRKKGSPPAHKEFDVAFRRATRIHADLSDKADVTAAMRLSWTADNSVIVCQGVTPGHSGFLLTPQERTKILRKDPASGKVIFPYLVGREMLAGDGRPARFIIDFGQQNILEARHFEGAFSHVQKFVLPDIESRADVAHKSDKSRSDHLQRWWMHWRSRREVIDAVAKLSRFMICSRVTKRPVFCFIHNSIRPGDALQCFAFADDYSFGILQSNVHWQWFIAKCSKLKADFRYTPESVFDTFPWPQSPSPKQVRAVAKAGREVRRVRDDALTKIKGGLRAVYRTLELPGKNPLRDAHAALDAAVLEAYDFAVEEDLLAQLLELNSAVAGRIEAGEAAVAPGVPPDYPTPADLITDDCIRFELPGP